MNEPLLILNDQGGGCDIRIEKRDEYAESARARASSYSFTESRHGEFKPTEIAGSIRNQFGTAGGGSETLIVCIQPAEPQRFIP